MRIILRVILMTILLLQTVFAGSGPCQACYMQRAAYAAECIVSPHLFKWYFRWCTKVYGQAELLHDYAKMCDRAIAAPRSSVSSLKNKRSKSVLDPCRYCINAVFLTATACIDGHIKPYSRCKQARKCSSYLWSTYRSWPYTKISQ